MDCPGKVSTRLRGDQGKGGVGEEGGEALGHGGRSKREQGSGEVQKRKN